MLFIPTMLAGTVVGVVINMFLPEWILLLLMVVVILYMALLTLKKSIDLVAIENDENEYTFNKDKIDTVSLKQVDNDLGVLDSNL